MLSKEIPTCYDFVNTDAEKRDSKGNLVLKRYDRTVDIPTIRTTGKGIVRVRW